MERIRIGVIGLGFGRHIVEELTTGSGAKHFELAAVCDSAPGKAAALADSYGCAAYTSIDDLLADDTIPAIGLYTGPSGRADLIRKIVDAGRDVMTTKPLEVHADLAQGALEHAVAIGRVVHLNSPSPTLPAELQQIEKWRVEYDLGRAVGCRRDVWGSYNEAADGSWYDYPELCPAAPVYRLGIYLINDLVRIFGPATQVSVLQSRIRTGRPTADNAQLGIVFANGAIANIFASFCVQDGDHYRNSMTLNFERGTIYGNVGPDRTAGVGFEISLVMGSDHRNKVASVQLEGHSGAYDWATFAAAIRGEHIAGAITPAEAVAGIRIIEAMKRAEKSGGVAQVVQRDGLI